MLQNLTNNKLIKKLIIIARLLFDELRGLLMMIASTYLIHIFFRNETHISGFVTGVTCGIIVWFILTKKHWLYPLCYSIIIFAYLVTKRAVDVGIAGFYLSEWYSSVELMTIYSTVATILLYKLTERIQKNEKSFVLFRGLCIILAMGILFFSGLHGDTSRKQQKIFSLACNMMIKQLFVMRNNINELLRNEQIDMNMAEENLDFDLASTAVLVESFLPENSRARKFNDYLKNQIRNFIFNYDDGVEKGEYKAGIPDRDRLIILRDFCSKLASDINATYGQTDKVEKVLSGVPESFRSLVESR